MNEVFFSSEAEAVEYFKKSVSENVEVYAKAHVRMYLRLVEQNKLIKNLQDANQVWLQKLQLATEAKGQAEKAAQKSKQEHIAHEKMLVSLLENKIKGQEEDIQSKNEAIEALELEVQSLKENASQHPTQDSEVSEDALEAFKDGDFDLALYVEALEFMEAEINKLRQDLEQEKTRSQNLETQIHSQDCSEKRSGDETQQLQETVTFLKNSQKELVVKQALEKEEIKQQVEMQMFQILDLENQLEAVQKEAKNQLVKQQVAEEKWANEASIRIAELEEKCATEARKTAEAVAETQKLKKTQQEAAKRRGTQLQRIKELAKRYEA
ncbi:hypothetical protein L596_021841 [Steinernema carpocapsae]|uniref:Uncharacterized protein n=1 Tax=Steinernema carpocapsae TaxID=34508 RepID=A0A4U5MKS3_STECR|nr:hypothetical protein L596_021841 [Steinernema carpocapsae]